jgi:hypothetical protein
LHNLCKISVTYPISIICVPPPMKYISIIASERKSIHNIHVKKMSRGWILSRCLAYVNIKLPRNFKVKYGDVYIIK